MPSTAATTATQMESAISLVVRLQFSLDRAYCRVERWKMQPHRVPDDSGSDVMILMAKDIADCGNVTPRNLGVLRLDRVRYVARGLGDDLDAPLDGALRLLVG